jgi:hypothetical protein
LAAKLYKISQPPGTDRTARALDHTHARNTDQLGVLVCVTPRIPLSKQMCTVCKGQSISDPSFMYLVPQIWLAYMLAGRAYALANQSKLCAEVLMPRLLGHQNPSHHPFKSNRHQLQQPHKKIHSSTHEKLSLNAIRSAAKIIQMRRDMLIWDKQANKLTATFFVFPLLQIIIFCSSRVLYLFNRSALALQAPIHDFKYSH